MKMNRFLIFVSLMFGMVACDDDSSFAPGHEPGNEAAHAYFASGYEAVYLYGEMPLEDTISLAVVRQGSLDELTLPIVVDRADTALHIPESVTFEAGQDTAWLNIASPYVEFTRSYDFSLRIPDAYADPYTVKEGTTCLESAVLWSEWTVLADTVLFYSSFPTQGCKIENLRGRNRFRFTNFLNSGHPLEFSVKCDGDFDSRDLTNNVGEINPLNNYYYGSSLWYYTNGGDYDPWCLTGTDSSQEISYIGFWPGRYYTYVDFRLNPKTAKTLKLNGKQYLNCYDNNYSMLCSYIKQTNGFEGYVYFYLSIGYLVEEE